MKISRADTTTVIPQINEIVEQVRKQYCPDQRLTVWAIKVIHQDNVYCLDGETDQKKAAQALTTQLKSVFPNEQFLNRIVVLPDDTMRGRNFGIIVNSVESLRSGPSIFKDMLTQTLRGLPVEILKSDDECFLVRTDDGYLGWIDDDRVVVGGDSLKSAWTKTPKVVFDDVEGIVYSSASVNSLPVTDVVLGNRFKLIGKHWRWTAVELPDGRKGFLPTKQVVTEEVYLKRKPTADKVLATAFSLLGRPYMWGATSPKALDCSGLTQTAYRRSGYLLLRDASMQATQGKAVDLTDFPARLKPGDLLFFGSKQGRITHTGIYMGNYEFIHCSGRVKINSFMPEASNYSEYLRKRLQVVRRIIPE